ncbi:MAG: N-acetylmuramoyl-L-alanine amidase family protein [Gemmatimonadota bacterium]
MLVALILIALLLQPTALAAQTALAIDAGSGTSMVTVERGRANAVFSLSALGLLGARIAADAQSARLTIFAETISFDFGSPFFRAGNDVFQLVAPAEKAGRQVMVSTQFLTEWLPRRFPEQLEFRTGVLRLTNRIAATRNPQPATRARHAPAPTPAPAPAPAERVVIVDAGHGGRDPGKIGPNGLAEKTVALSVATKLSSLLRERGFEVHMTRAIDTLVALADRPRLANQWKDHRPAVLFVSIHANAGAASAQGFETYFLSEARTDDERRVAEMENAAVAYEDAPAAKGPALDLLLNGLRNDYYQRASNDFAEVIQRELGAFHPGRNRGVKQAGFRVLVGALMPAVLVEIAFISNPGEARLLGTSAFQEKIAYSLARSIANFFATHEHLFVATEAGR